MNAGSGPQHLSEALSKLVVLRGIARVGGSADLASIWRELAGSAIAAKTRVLGIKRGVLQIGVSNAPLLGELVSFHKESLVRQLQNDYADLDVRDIKFRLKSEMAE